MIIRISSGDISAYMTMVLNEMAEKKIIPAIATVEQNEESGMWTFKLTYTAVE